MNYIIDSTLRSLWDICPNARSIELDVENASQSQAGKIVTVYSATIALPDRRISVNAKSIEGLLVKVMSEVVRRAPVTAHPSPLGNSQVKHVNRLFPN